MQVSTSSDDPLINDVLYASGGIDPVCLVYGGNQAGGIGPDPATPYPPNYSLAQFNANLGNIRETYKAQVNSCARTTFPTNAGFIGYTPQEMYILRGWAFAANQNPTTGTVEVPMRTAGAAPTSASVSTAIAAFTPFLAPETNSTATGEIKASAGQSAVPGILAGAQNYYTVQNPASSNGCPANRYVVLVTDGLPTVFDRFVRHGYWLLLQPGGLLIGDDWRWLAVRCDVLRFTYNNNVKVTALDHLWFIKKQASL